MKHFNVGQETVALWSVPQWESSCVVRPCISSASQPAELPGETNVMVRRIDINKGSLQSHCNPCHCMFEKKNKSGLFFFSFLPMWLFYSLCFSIIVSDEPVLRDRFYNGNVKTERGAVIHAATGPKPIYYSWTVKGLFSCTILMGKQELLFSVLPSHGFELDLWKSCLKAKRWSSSGGHSKFFLCNFLRSSWPV